MITGIEIRNHQFSKSLFGFRQEEVREFIEQVAHDYETVYSENAQLRENIQKQLFELEKYRKLEATMNNSLILAQQTAEELKLNARQEATKILEDSKRSIAEMLAAYQELMRHLNVFNLEMKTQLQVELELLDSNLKKNQEVSAFFTKPDIQALLDNLNNLRLEDTE
ncbi:MAG: DivIVA domain-containing protein [Syntrophomonadaceae bacterium]|nr:DivIVA domain-containing protein [Syntrophomonadaceae bacterium]